VKTSSAQITAHYGVDELLGKQVLCVCNFAPKSIAGVRSEVLVTGVYDSDDRVVWLRQAAAQWLAPGLRAPPSAPPFASDSR
jgi:tRNA-binding EMAP/Myf-like protein